MDWSELEERGIIAFLMLERLDRVFSLLRDEWTLPQLYERVLGSFSVEHRMKFEFTDGSRMETNAPPGAFERTTSFSGPQRGVVSFETRFGCSGRAQFSWSKEDGWKLWHLTSGPTGLERTEQTMERISQLTAEMVNRADLIEATPAQRIPPSPTPPSSPSPRLLLPSKRHKA